LANFKINIMKYSIRGYTFGYLLVFIWSIFKWSTYGFNPVVVPGIFEPFYADHTIYAASGVFLFLFWVFAAFNAGQKEKILAITVAIAVLMAIRVANSRAAFLSLPVGFIVVFGVLKGFRKRHLALTMAAVFALLFMYRNAIYNWISYNDYNSRDEHAGLLERTASVGNVQTDVSNLERINRWVAALNMFNEKPIIGFGPGTFQYSYIQYQDSKYMNRLSVTDVYHIPKNSGGTVHSEPLLFLSELGGLGFLAWLILIVTWIWWLLSVPKANRSIYLAVSAGMLATYLFHGLFNNFLNTDKLAFLFWGCAAIMMIELENGNKRKSIL
ncbi:MAG: O-antigen ligase family protein, partial [Bacteroidia bacterium]